MRKMIKRLLLTEEDAFMQDGGGFFLATLVLVIGLALIMQINSITRITEEVNRQLEKGAAIAIKGSIYDEWRMDYIARIDTDKAEDILYEYIEDNMHMTKSGNDYIKRTDDGDLLYSFRIEHDEYDEGGSLSERDGIPEIKMTGKITIPATIFPAINGGYQFVIPFNVTASNRRIVYEGDM